MPARVYVAQISKQQELRKLVAYDPYLDNALKEEDLSKIRDDEMANIIFARQDCVIKEGAALNLEREKVYLYISATDEFLEKADKKLKAQIEGIERADQEIEQKIIATINEEQSKAESGFGFIFG
ncbi:MAG: hypothetical protein KGH61_02740 [Candidatus Micrarchaeota archaeon]|nr:hypothetical protein [Candidatus Micrarchaeota archaeon]MDE1847842.1 hypothetical protein [Candidatus Micrarchaeota archaeon]MDE1864352.1 hypothetical protein [Candidatus Micrarchaeota archaeon]